MGFSTPKQEVLESPPPPPISKNSPKYADHPSNDGHGFAALSFPNYVGTTLHHPNKCKVVSINTKNSSLKLANFRLLPFSRFNYTLGNNILDYENNEQDLGVIVNNNFSWSEQQVKVINKTSQMLGLTKRSHFVVSNHRKRTLYLTLVRSQFEICSVIWRPVTPTQISKFEALQKNAIKWILNEDFLSYSDYNVYIKKCGDVNVLPINNKFDLNDLILFHKIDSGYVHVDLPNYISKFNGVSRLRENHLDLECYTCNLNPSNARIHSPIYKNYFYRVIHIWNKLPYNVKITANTETFKSLVTDFLWDSQNEVALNYHNVRGLYFLAVVFAPNIIKLVENMEHGIRG